MTEKPTGNGTRIQWDMRISPQFFISCANLLVMVFAVVGMFVKMQSDIGLQKEQVTRLETLINSTVVEQRGLVATIAKQQQDQAGEFRGLVEGTRKQQAEQAVEMGKLGTKVDLMLPAIQKLEAAIVPPRAR